MPLTLASSHEEIVAEVRAWIRLLAQGEFERALERIPPQRAQRWSPQLLKAVIAGYGLPEPHPSGTEYRVTSPDTAMGGPPTVTVEKTVVSPGALAHVEHDLPLNGAWSDLTATFSLYPHGAGAELVLEEVHVF